MMMHLWARFFAALLLSFLAGGLTIWLARLWTVGVDSHHGIQKLHQHRVPRLGGIPIFLAVLGVGIASIAGIGWVHGVELAAIMALPLSAGLLEDISGRASVLTRLGVTLLAAAACAIGAGAMLSHVEVGPIDWFLQFAPFALIFTTVAAAGIPHAVNIVDGCNGLAGSVSICALIALGCVARNLGDGPMADICWISAGATSGFLIWNFPFGKIFLGDGGSYFVGFLIAELSIILLCRHPNVSPWFPMTLVVYPVWETLFSFMRRARAGLRRTVQPDSKHLHQLVYMQLVRYSPVSPTRIATLLNSFTSVPFMIWSLLSALVAVRFYNVPEVLKGTCALFAIAYTVTYMVLPRVAQPRRDVSGPAREKLRTQAAANEYS